MINYLKYLNKSVNIRIKIIKILRISRKTKKARCILKMIKNSKIKRILKRMNNFRILSIKLQEILIKINGNKKIFKILTIYIAVTIKLNLKMH